MTVRRRWATGVMGLALAGVVACGSEDPGIIDPGPDTPEGLTQAEAALVVGAMLSAFTPSPDVDTSGGGGAAVPMVTIVADTSTTTTTCTGGGSVTAMNRDSVRIVTDSRVMPTPDTTVVVDASFGGTAQITAQFSNCASTDQLGNVWTVNATPGFAWDVTLSGDQRVVQLTSGVTDITSNINWDALWGGSFSWTNGSRSGTCPISVQVSSATATANGQTTSTFTQTGQVCGLTVNRNGP